MISTTTTSVISSITSTGGIAAGLGLIAVLALISFLITKEMASVGGSPRMERLSRFLNVAIVPLLIVFGSIVASRVVEAL
jgi:hypothetical protein